MKMIIRIEVDKSDIEVRDLYGPNVEVTLNLDEKELRELLAKTDKNVLLKEMRADDILDTLDEALIADYLRYNGWYVELDEEETLRHFDADNLIEELERRHLVAENKKTHKKYIVLD